MQMIRNATQFVAWIAVVFMALVGPAVAAKGDRQAVVAGGEQITLAKSRFSNRELNARRPQMDTLIPRVSTDSN